VLELEVLRRSEQEGEGWWHPVASIGQAGLPTLYRKAAEVAPQGNERLAA
jgi:A/G-specific adenine glycosylase